MAKFLLSLFGGGSVLSGIVVILGGIYAENGLALSISLYAGSGLLLAGAPLLGLARVIVLLEKIASNTKVAELIQSVERAPARLTLEEMMAQHLKENPPAAPPPRRA